MKNVESVTELDGNRSHWVVKAPAGRKVEWDAVIHNEIEGEMIAWRSLPGADVDNAGSVWFKEAPAGRGTEVKVELQYNPPAGALGAVVAQPVGQGARAADPGRPAPSEADHRGRRNPHHRRPAHAAGSRTSPQGDREVHRASEESFPASDSPAYNH